LMTSRAHRQCVSALARRFGAHCGVTDQGIICLRHRRCRLACRCATTAAGYDFSRRRWRNLDLGACQAWLGADIHRIDCHLRPRSGLGDRGMARLREVRRARPRQHIRLRLSRLPRANDLVDRYEHCELPPCRPWPVSRRRQRPTRSVPDRAETRTGAQSSRHTRCRSGFDAAPTMRSPVGARKNRARHAAWEYSLISPPRIGRAVGPCQRPRR
jgi:hypothetical protein